MLRKKPTLKRLLIPGIKKKKTSLIKSGIEISAMNMCATHVVKRDDTMDKEYFIS